MGRTPVDPAISGTRRSRASLSGEEVAETYCPSCRKRYPADYKLCPADGTELHEADELVGATLADSYHVVRILGEGGMGRVYEAHHTRLESKRFAIKTLHDELAFVPQVVARFRREAEVAAAIDSPHVVAVYDVGETADGKLYLVSELLEGIELGVYLKNHGTLPLPAAVRIVRQMCKALAAAHEKGAVHRDLKPENVFLTGDPALPTVKVLDFGIAKFDDQSGKALTKTGMIMGTPAYMAPEQARGERVDQRADIYGVGAILYAAVSGHAPFEAEDPAGVIVQVLTSEPARLRSYVPSLPGALEVVIERAMSADREVRYQTIAELDADLAPFDPGEEALAADGAALAPGALASAPTMVRGAEPERAADAHRSELVLLGSLAAGWLGLGLLAALSALLRLQRGGTAATLSLGEALLLLLVSVLIVGGPSFAIARHVRATRWKQPDAVAALAEALRVPVLVGASVYGLSSLLMRFSELVLLRAAGAAWPGWDLLLLGVSIAAAALAALPRALESRGSMPAALSALLERPAWLALLAAVGLSALFVFVPFWGDGGDAAASAPPGAIAEMREVLALEEALKQGKLDEARAHLEELGPEALAAPDVRDAALELASRTALAGGDTADATFELLSEELGEGGIDVLYRLHTEKGGSKAAERGVGVLADEEVRARGSKALRIAYEIRHAPSCEALVALLDRAAAEGDARAGGELEIVLTCAREDRCCLEGDARVKSTLDALRKRGAN